MTSTEPPASEYLQWLTIEKGRSLATIEAYRRDIGAFWRWLDHEGLELASVSDSDYVTSLRSGARADSSVARAMSSIHGWFGFMVDEGQLDVDPTARIRGARRGRTLPKPLGEEQMLALLDSLNGERPVDLRDRALLELLYGTGARVSEVVGIGLEDLDFDEELILVTGKGSKQRLVPMGPGATPSSGWARGVSRREEVHQAVLELPRRSAHSPRGRPHHQQTRLDRGH